MIIIMEKLQNMSTMSRDRLSLGSRLILLVPNAHVTVTPCNLLP